MWFWITVHAFPIFAEVLKWIVAYSSWQFSLDIIIFIIFANGHTNSNIDITSLLRVRHYISRHFVVKFNQFLIEIVLELKIWDFLEDKSVESSSWANYIHPFILPILTEYLIFINLIVSVNIFCRHATCQVLTPSLKNSQYIFVPWDTMNI